MTALRAAAHYVILSGILIAFGSTIAMLIANRENWDMLFGIQIFGIALLYVGKALR